MPGDLQAVAGRHRACLPAYWPPGGQAGDGGEGLDLLLGAVEQLWQSAAPVWSQTRYATNYSYTKFLPLPLFEESVLFQIPLPMKGKQKPIFGVDNDSVSSGW